MSRLYDSYKAAQRNLAKASSLLSDDAEAADKGEPPAPADTPSTSSGHSKPKCSLKSLLERDRRAPSLPVFPEEEQEGILSSGDGPPDPLPVRKPLALAFPNLKFRAPVAGGATLRESIPPPLQIVTTTERLARLKGEPFPANTAAATTPAAPSSSGLGSAWETALGNEVDQAGDRDLEADALWEANLTQPDRKLPTRGDLKRKQSAGSGGRKHKRPLQEPGAVAAVRLEGAADKEELQQPEGASETLPTEQQRFQVRPSMGTMGEEDGVEAEGLVLGEMLGVTMSVPAALNMKLREYQRTGVQFLFSLYSRGIGGLLADDMGLGKTIQTVALVSAILGKQGTEEDTIPPKGGYMKKVLVVTPSTLLTNWLNEFETWGNFAVAIAQHEKRFDVMQQVMGGALEIVLISYNTLRLHVDEVAAVQWEAVICDEAHNLKDPKGKSYKAAMQLKTTGGIRRYGLSGTVMQNKFEELWGLLNWAVPGGVGDKASFMGYYARPIQHGQRADADLRTIGIGKRRQQRLKNDKTLRTEVVRSGDQELLAKYMLRRTKESELRDELPTKRDNIVFCQMSYLQKRAYQRFLDTPDVQALRGAHKPCDCGSGESRGACCYRHPQGTLWYQMHCCECDDEKCTRHNPDGCSRCPNCLLLPALSYLQKISNHLELIKANSEKDDDVKTGRVAEMAHQILGEDAAELRGVYVDKDFTSLASSTHCGKMRVLEKLLHLWSHSDNKVLVFSYSVRMLDIIELMLSVHGFVFLRLDGSTLGRERQKRVDEFNNNRAIYIFLISTKAGGLGLNLTSANKVVVFDPNWNPALDLQAQDRAFRIGQRRRVNVYRLVSVGSVEELVYSRQIYKQQQSNLATEKESENRYFTGVQGDKRRQGELFGRHNLFKLNVDRVETKDIMDRQQAKQDEWAYRIQEYSAEDPTPSSQPGTSIQPVSTSLPIPPAVQVTQDVDHAMQGFQHLAGQLVDMPADEDDEDPADQDALHLNCELQAAAHEHSLSQDDGMVFLRRSSYVAYEHQHEQILGGSSFEEHLRQAAARHVVPTLAKDELPPGPLEPNAQPSQPSSPRHPGRNGNRPGSASAQAAREATNPPPRALPPPPVAPTASPPPAPTFAVDAMAAWQGTDRLQMAQQLLMWTPAERNLHVRAFAASVLQV